MNIIQVAEVNISNAIKDQSDSAAAEKSMQKQWTRKLAEATKKLAQGEGTSPAPSLLSKAHCDPDYRRYWQGLRTATADSHSLRSARPVAARDVLSVCAFGFTMSSDKPHPAGKLPAHSLCMPHLFCMPLAQALGPQTKPPNTDDVQNSQPVRKAVDECTSHAAAHGISVCAWIAPAGCVLMKRVPKQCEECS